MPDLLQILLNFSSVIPHIMKLFKGVCGLMAIWLVSNGLFELYAASNDNYSKFFSGRKSYSVIGGFTSVIIGSLLMGFTNLDVINITTRSLTGDHVTSEILTYAGNTGTSLSEKGKEVLKVIFQILQVLGFVAYVKSFWIFNARFGDGSRSSDASMGKAIGFLVGGFLAWNAKWVIDVINNQLGIDLIGLFFN